MPIGLAKFKRTRIMLTSLHISSKRKMWGSWIKMCFKKNVNFLFFFKHTSRVFLTPKSFLSGESNEKKQVKGLESWVGGKERRLSTHVVGKQGCAETTELDYSVDRKKGLVGEFKLPRPSQCGEGRETSKRQEEPC